MNLLLNTGLLYGLNLSDSISPSMSALSVFHDYCLLVAILVTSIILIGLYSTFYFSGVFLSFSDNKWLEIYWTCLPAVVLVALAVPSLRLLYTSDSTSVESGSHLVSVTAHQWYWTFSFFFNNTSLEYDSYMLSSNKAGGFRLLEVDNPLFVCLNTVTGFLVTSDDVLHSFCLPNAGIKVDCIPGRLNLQHCLFSKLGVFYGQCSEICGANHSFMPVSLEVV